MKMRIKRHGMTLTIFTMLFIIFYDKVLPKNYSVEVDAYLDILGIILVFLGFWFRLSARGYKSQMSDVGHKLVVDGPFSLVRNPMYLGVFFIGIGIILAAWNWWVILFFITFFFCTYVPQIKEEEKYLLKTFPDTYSKYCQEVPAFFPRLRVLLKKNIKEVLPLKLSWVKREWFSIVFVLLLMLCYDLYGNILSFGPDTWFLQTAIFLGTTALISGFITLLFYHF